MSKIIVETANREFAQDAVRRMIERVEKYLYAEAEKYEPETDNYINGRLDFVVDIKIGHEAYIPTHPEAGKGDDHE